MMPCVTGMVAAQFFSGAVGTGHGFPLKASAGAKNETSSAAKMRGELAMFFFSGPLHDHDACSPFLSHVAALCLFQHFQVLATNTV
jgi:hypothetical protein